MVDLDLFSSLRSDIRESMKNELIDLEHRELVVPWRKIPGLSQRVRTHSHDCKLYFV